VALEREQSIKRAKISNDKVHGIKQYCIVQCFKCKHYFVIEIREKTFVEKQKFFCSMTCSHTRNHSEETKQKIKYSMCKNGMTLSEYTTQLWKNEEYSKRVLIRNPRFTSKGERELRDWFIATFFNEAWTFGGSLSYRNVTGISRDLYSSKLKICIEYDGVWHFVEINGQLQSKQLKDQALESWCIENGWRLIRIKDELFQSNPSYWKNKIREEVLKGTDQIVKYYT
jgi:hypothetical protein